MSQKYAGFENPNFGDTNSSVTMTGASTTGPSVSLPESLDGLKSDRKCCSLREIILSVITVIALGVSIVLAIVAAGIEIPGITPAHNNGTSGAVGQNQTGSTTDGLCMEPSCLEAASFKLISMDKSRNPCQDFYNYACGNWINWHQISPAESEETAFTDIYKRNVDKLKRILANDPNGVDLWSTERKAKVIIEQCQNDFARAIAGARPMLGILESSLGGWDVFGTLDQKNWDYQKSLREVHVDYWTDALFTFKVGTDWYDTTKRVIEIDQGGLGMGWFNYIQPESERIRTSYRTYMQTVAGFLIRDSNTTLDFATQETRVNRFINDVMTVETAIANILKETLPTDNPHDDDERVTLSQMNTQYPGIDWVDFFSYMYRDAGVTAGTYVVILEKDYVSRVAQYVNGLGDNKARMMNNYLTWRLAQNFAQHLSWDYVHANREFYVAQTGRQEFLGTWQFCFNIVADKMDMALGSLFVQDHFADASKSTIHDIVTLLKDSLYFRVDNLKWMDQQTLWRARTKLQSLDDKLGYDDILMDRDRLDTYYESLRVDPRNHFQNLINLGKFEKERQNTLLKNGEDRSVWQIKVFGTEARYSQSWNEVLVPAGILQFPVFNRNVPKYHNYGAMGSNLASQVLLAIDELGGYYLPNGTVYDWWTPWTEQAYLKTKTCWVNYYNSKRAGPYKIPGSDAQGVTLSINGGNYARYGIAEAGGVRIALDAYRKYNSMNKEKNAPGLELTNDQVFFLSWAQTKCYNRRDEASYNMVLGGQVPEDIVVNGALSQLKEFADTFSCPAGTPMNPSQRCDGF